MCVSQVWFRRGVNSHNPTGLGWISVGGEMMMITVGHSDQVRQSRVLEIEQGRKDVTAHLFHIFCHTLLPLKTHKDALKVKTVAYLSGIL